MKKSYTFSWFLIFTASAFTVFWIVEGRALLRKRFFLDPIAREERTESQFVAVLFPRISKKGERFTLSSNDFQNILEGLKRRGYATVGLDDIRSLYVEGRRLPPKALLLAFDKDYPKSVELAEAGLKKCRMRAALFIETLASSANLDQRKFLTGYTASQMHKSGAWEFGWQSGSTALTTSTATVSLPSFKGLGKMYAFLDNGFPVRIKNAKKIILKLKAGETGFNDMKSGIRNLRIMRLNSEYSADEILHIIDSSWPRKQEFKDVFTSKRLGLDWISAWGNISSGKPGLALIPTPKHTGAAVLLRGTESWRDVMLEFELKKYRKEFWIYARHQDDDRYVRIGARDGFWHVEQKTGSKSLSTVLGRAPISEPLNGSRVRLILKGDWAILHVNGRMQFGKALQINPKIDRGSIQLAAYDPEPKTASAIVKFFRAIPIGHEWVSWDHGRGTGFFDENYLGSLREAAVTARALSPRWLTLHPDGGITLAAQQHRDLIASLAGFYRCELIPTAEFPASLTPLLNHPALAGRLLAGLVQSASEFDAAGLNLNLRRLAPEPKLIAFLAQLRDQYRARGRKLWITLEGEHAAPELLKAVDGILTPSDKKMPGLRIWTSQALLRRSS